MQLAAAYAPPPPRLARDARHDEIAELRAEIEALRAERDYLKESLAPQEFALPHGAHLTTAETKAASRLLLAPPNTVVTTAQVYRALYLDDDRELNAVHAVIHRVRKKFAVLGVTLKSIGKSGYCLDRRSHTALRALAQGPGTP